MDDFPTCGADLLARIEGAGLLEKCGGPYPHDPTLSPLASLTDAVGIIVDMQLDPSPHSPWERQVYAASHECEVTLRRGKGFRARLAVGRQTKERKRSVKRLTAEAMEASLKRLRPLDRNVFVVEDQLSYLFYVASLLLDAGLASSRPLIMQATRYALLGYLPVDFAEGEGVGRVVIY